MAVVATLSKGYDLDYVWRQVGGTATRGRGGLLPPGRGERRRAAGPVVGPGRRGSRLRGRARWWSGSRTTCCSASGRRRTARQLGRPPSGGRAGGGPVRPAVSRRAARDGGAAAGAAGGGGRRARQSPLYFDLTISFSKSISIFHASLGENARLARQAGDADGEAYWSALVGEVDEMIWQAVYAGFDYFQREAGYTRTGSHASRVDGRETGQWHEADLAVAHWLQHTSRDGDMQLHVHSQIAHVARTVKDGKWRAPDSYGYNEHVGAVAGDRVAASGGGADPPVRRGVGRAG